MSENTAPALERLKAEPEVCAFRPRSVVVPLDGSSDSEAALPMAAYLAGLFGVAVRVVHAIDAESTDAGAASTFQGYVADLASAGRIPATSCAEVIAGAAAEVILGATAEDDLVVLATHGRGGLRAAMFGSVADKAVRGAKAPTLAVPVTHEGPLLPIRNVVIAVDESESAAHAASIGRTFAAICGATVTLVNSYLPPAPVGAGPEAAYIPADATDIVQHAAEALVADVAEPGEGQYAVLGPAADAIADTSSQLGAELVVAGSSGRGFFGRLLAGSVSEALMHRLDRPLLVVPAPAA